MITQIWLVLIFFTDIILWLIFADIILSWLSLFWLRWRPSFLDSVVWPIYDFINKLIPTKFWMFRFDALIAIIALYFVQALLIANIPWLKQEVLRLMWTI